MCFLSVTKLVGNVSLISHCTTKNFQIPLKHSCTPHSTEMISLGNVIVDSVGHQSHATMIKAFQTNNL
jgi:hypothetical protein